MCVCVWRDEAGRQGSFWTVGIQASGATGPSLTQPSSGCSLLREACVHEKKTGRVRGKQLPNARAGTAGPLQKASRRQLVRARSLLGPQKRSSVAPAATPQAPVRSQLSRKRGPGRGNDGGGDGRAARPHARQGLWCPTSSCRPGWCPGPAAVQTAKPSTGPQMTGMQLISVARR